MGYSIYGNSNGGDGMGWDGIGGERGHHGPEKPYAEPNNRDSP